MKDDGGGGGKMIRLDKVRWERTKKKRGIGTPSG